MAIWMDMTYSMEVWKGGIIGIVRAELEMAKNLHACNKEIRFCKADVNGFTEIKEEDLEWLWNSDKTGDAYLQQMGRLKKKNVDAFSPNMPEGLGKAFAYSSGRLDRINRLFHMCIIRTPKMVRFLTIILTGIVGIPLKIASTLRLTYLRKIKEPVDLEQRATNCHAKYYPFKDGDFLFCAGWYSCEGIIKEKLISEIKDVLPNLSIAYLIYDLVLSNESTQALYEGRIGFERYLTWIACNCDYIFYGGRTAQKDAEEFFRKKELPIRPGHYLKFGSDVAKVFKDIDILAIRKKYGIEDNYILAVGTVDAKKNYTVLYHAYVLMQDNGEVNVPQLVIVGGKYGDPYLSEMMELDPKVKGRIVFARPDDDELVTLYKNSEFTVLPTWYEGWSLTLPESLLHGKFCLASDVAPLREIAGDLVDYVSPDDAKAWADKIRYYSKHSESVKKYEQKITREFKVQTWKACAEELNGHLMKINNDLKKYTDSHMFYDLSLAFASCVLGASVSGILRTQLVLARYLCRWAPHMRFIAFTDKKCIALDRFMLMELVQDQSIEDAVRHLQPVFRFALDDKEGKKKKSVEETYTNGEIYWMATSLLPKKLRAKAVDWGQKIRKGEVSKALPGAPLYDMPFREQDIFFSTGVGYSASIYKTISVLKSRKNFKFIQLIYDFTPILFPQVHTPETREFYIPFLQQTYQLCDEIFYGGETAMRDGMAYQEKYGLPMKQGFPLKFGSNIVTSKQYDGNKLKEELWEKLGITGRYIMAVGSIEARKNHETLYLAYLAMLREHDDLPQMLFCGYPGWKTQEFIKRLNRDERVRNKIIICTPSDDELDLLYRNCEFTVLASLYEGWSLTLPESLNYGKMCICTDAAPMREIGGTLLEYVDAFDAIGWADAIWRYYANANLLEQKEQQIRQAWKPISWYDCSQQVYNELDRICEEEISDND